MDTKYEKVVGLAVKNGYSLERFQEILAQNNYSQADIDAASELYNVKKKDTTSFESQDQGASTESTLSSVDESSLSAAPSTSTSQGADYALGQKRQDILDAVGQLDMSVKPLPYNTIKQEEDFFRLKNDQEGYLEVARRRQKEISRINSELSDAVTPGQKLALGAVADRVNADYKSVTGDTQNIINKDGLKNEEALNNLAQQYNNVSKVIYDDVLEKSKEKAENLSVPLISSMFNSITDMTTRTSLAFSELDVDSERLDDDYAELDYTAQVNALATQFAMGIDEDNVNKGITESLKEGNYADAFKKTSIGVAQTVPQIAFTIVAPEVALPVMGATSAANQWSAVRDREDLNTAQKVSLAVVAGAAEYVFERIGIGEINKARKAIGLIDELPKATRIARAKDWISQRNSIAGQVVNSKVAGVLGSATAEGLEEVGVELTNTAAAFLIAGDKDFNIYEVADSFIVGAAAGGGTASVPAVLASGFSALGSQSIVKDRIKIVNNIKRIKDLAGDPTLSAEERNELELELERSSLELQELVNRDEKFYASMNESDQQELLSLNQKIRAKVDLHSKMKTEESKARITREVQDLVKQKQSIEKSYGDPFSVVEKDGKVERKPYKDRKRAEKINNMLNELGIGQVEDTAESLEDSTVEFTEQTDLNSIVDDFLGDITDKQLQKFGTSRMEIMQSLKETRNMFSALKGINPDSKIFLHKTPKAFEQSTGESALESNGIFLPKESGNNEIHLFVPALAAGTAIHEVGHEIAGQMGSGFIQEFVRGMQTAIEADEFLSERYGSFLQGYIEEGADLGEIQEEFFAEFLQDLARGNVSIEVEKSLLNKLRNLLNKYTNTDLKITDERSTLVEAVARMGEKIARGEDIIDEALIATVSLEDGTSAIAVDASQNEIVGKAKKRQIITSEDASTYSFKDVVNRVNGRVLVITSDNTGVGNVGGDELYGGILYSFLPENMRDGVGFASVDESTVSTVMNFVDRIGPEGQDVAVLVMQQSPGAMLGNYYGMKYFLDSVSKSVPKEQTREVLDNLKQSIIGKKDVIESLKSGIPTIDKIPEAERANIDYTKYGKWKGRTEQEREASQKIFEDFISMLDSIDELTPQVISKLIDVTSFKFRKSLMEFLIPMGYGKEGGSFGIKKPYANKKAPLIKQILAENGYSQFDFFSKYSQPEFAQPDELIAQLKEGKEGDWGYIYSGFITNKNLDFGSEFQSNAGVVHPQFNAKIPSTENFLLDSGYQVNDKFKDALKYKDSNKKPLFARVSIAGSMFMGSRDAESQADVVTLANSLLGGEKKGVTTQSVIKNTAKKRKRVQENKMKPSKDGSWFVSRDFESVMNDFPDLYKESLDDDEASGTGNETQVTTNNGTYQKMINYFKGIDKNFKKKTFADINGGLGTSNQLKYANGIENYQVIEPFYDRKRFPVYSMTMEDANKAVTMLGLKESDKPHGELNKYVKKNEENFTRFEELVKKGELPSSKLKPDYIEQNGYDIPSESIDYAMSNAVLNVIPGDIRQDVVLNFGRALKIGGVGILSTRGTDVATNKSNVSLSEDPLEFYVASKYTYQKGFKPAELQAYVQDVLGENFVVERYNKLSGPAVVIKRVDNSENLESKFVFQKEGLKPKKRMSAMKVRMISNNVSTEMIRGLKKKGYSVDQVYNRKSKSTISNYQYLIARKGAYDVRLYAIRISDHSEAGSNDIYYKPFLRVDESSHPLFKQFKRDTGLNFRFTTARVFNAYDFQSYNDVLRAMENQNLAKASSIKGLWNKFSRRSAIEGFVEAYGMLPEEGRDKAFEDMIYEMGFEREVAKEFTKLVSSEYGKEITNQEGFGRVVMANVFKASKRNDNVLLNKFFGDIEAAIRSGKELDDIMEQYKEDLSRGVTKEELRVRIAKFSNRLSKSLLDRQTNVKRLINESGLEGVEDLLVTKAGAGAWSKIQFNKFEKDIYGGLNLDLLDALDQIIFAKRIIQIDTNFDNREKERPKHPRNFTKEKAEESLKGLRFKLGTEVVEELEERADKYFESMRELFKEAYDNGLVTEDAYEALKNDDYVPRQYLNFVLNPEEGTFRNSDALSKDFLKELKAGSEESLIMDSRYLLQMHTLNTINKVFTNRMVSSLADQVGDTDLEWIKPANVRMEDIGEPVDIRDEGEEPLMYQPQIEKVGKPDQGYRNLYFFRGGKLQAMQIKSEYHDELLDLEIIAKAGGPVESTLGALNSLLRFNATGAGNPLFFMKDFFRNILYTVFRSDVYGRTSFTLSTAALVKDTLIGMKDKMTGSQDFLDLASHGGLMDFLAVESNPYKNMAYRKADVLGFVKRGVQKVTTGLTYMSETTEIGTRLAVYKRDLQQRIADFVEENGHEPTADQLEGMKFASARASREVLDFSQGGIGTKKIDKTLAPYLNVAVQSTRGMVEAIKNDPIKFFRYVTELGVVSAAITYVRISLGGEDDDDIAEYDKRKNFIFWLGDKKTVDENENPIPKDKQKRNYLRIPKSEQIAGFLRVFEMMAEKELKGDGAFKNWTREDWSEISKAFSMFVPVQDAGSFVPPFVQAWLAYEKNYDMFRDQAVSLDFDKVLPMDEGADNDRIEYFYKAIGKALNASPERMKSATEKMVTTPQNSLLVSTAYGIADALAYGLSNLGEDVKANSKEVTGYSVVKALNPQERFIRETNPRLKDYQEQPDIKKLELEQGSKELYIKLSVEKYIDQAIRGEITASEVKENIIRDIEGVDMQKMAYNFVKRAVISKEYGITGKHWDIYKSRSARIQAEYLVTYYKNKEDMLTEIGMMRQALRFRPQPGLEKEIDKILNERK